MTLNNNIIIQYTMLLKYQSHIMTSHAKMTVCVRTLFLCSFTINELEKIAYNT